MKPRYITFKAKIYGTEDFIEGDLVTDLPNYFIKPKDASIWDKDAFVRIDPYTVEQFLRNDDNGERIYTGDWIEIGYVDFDDGTPIKVSTVIKVELGTDFRNLDYVILTEEPKEAEDSW